MSSTCCCLCPFMSEIFVPSREGHLADGLQARSTSREGHLADGLQARSSSTSPISIILDQVGLGAL